MEDLNEIGITKTTPAPKPEPIRASFSIISTPSTAIQEPNQNGVKNTMLLRQKELTELNEQRFLTLENLLNQKEESLKLAKEKWTNLKEDFEYNLKLLEGRDEELKKYDQTFEKLKKILQDKFS